MDDKKKMIALAIVAVLLVGTVAVAIGSGVFNQAEEAKDTDGAFEVLQTDGTKVTLEGVADRIVVANANAAEMVFLLGAGQNVVGASSATLNRAGGPQMFPNAVNIGSSTTPDTEVLATLDADVIIAFSTMAIKNQPAVESLGITVVYIDCYNLKDIDQDVRSLAAIVGNTQKGEAYIEYYHSYLDMIDDRIKGVDPADYPRTYVEFSSDYAAQAAGTSSDVALGLVGGLNVYGDEAYGTIVSRESVIGENPEYIFKIVAPADMTAGKYDAFVGREGFSDITAVEEGSVYLVRNDLSYGPRGFVAALIFAKAFYPDLFTNVNISGTLVDFNEEFGSTFDTTVTTYPALPAA